MFQTFQRDALGVLAAGDRDVYRAECLRMLESPDVHAARAAAESLGLTAAGTADEGLVAAIRAARVGHGSCDEFAEALARLGGSEASTAAEADSDEQGPITRMRVFWRNKGLSLDQALSRLQELGALPEGRAPAELAGEVRRAFREYWPDREERPSDLFLQAMGAAGVLTEFDTEADVIPPPHDELILEIAGTCDPLFSVESARQTWKLPRGVKDPDDLDGDLLEKTSYVVEFLHDGRLYTFRADYFGDWYDAGGLTTALNFALRNAGRAERFHPVDTEGQETTLVLVTPATAKILRKEFLVPVGKAPEQSLGQGRGKKSRRRDED
ncbi:MAG: hypothetical protein U0835_13860 [Isosphaeraceae bacterium]